MIYKLIELLKEYNIISINFFGEIIVKFKAGKIYCIERKDSLNVESLG